MQSNGSKLALLIGALVLAGLGMAQERGSPRSGEDQQAQPGQGGGQEASAIAGPDPFTRDVDSFISIGGSVDAISEDSFLLNFGGGNIRVDMDSPGAVGDASRLMQGDRVNVEGIIDDGFFELRSIEAGSVYVERLGTSFQASTDDDEEYGFLRYTPSTDPHMVLVQGRVSAVDGEEFILNTGSRRVKVDADGLPGNPLHSASRRQVKVGDVVSVTGSVDDGFFGAAQLNAVTVTFLRAENSSTSQAPAAVPGSRTAAPG